MKGNLTIKGITNPVEFVSEYSEEDGIFIFTGHIEIDRTLYDVRYRSAKFFKDLGDRAISDVFTLDFELYAIMGKVKSQ